MKTTCRFFIVGVLPIFLASCTGIFAERIVENNRIESTGFGIKVQADPTFEYIGKWSERTVTGSGGGRVSREYFIFAKRYPNGIVSHGIAIEFHELDSGHYWLSDLFSGIKNYIDRGTDKLADNTFQYILFPHDNIATGGLRQFLTEKNLVFSNCMLFKRYAITSRDNRVLMNLIYMEDLFYNDRTNYNTVARWTDKSLLDDSQKGFIRGFSERAKSALFFDIYGSLSSQEDKVTIEKTEVFSCPDSLDGIWKGTMITKSTNPNCADSGSFEGFVKDCRIDGELKTSNNLVFEINGRIDSDGRLVGGIASHRNNVGSFSGSFTEWIASGTWQDDFDCYGTWEAEKISSDESSIERRLIKLKELFDKGLISEPFYNKKKADILGEL